MFLYKAPPGAQLANQYSDKMGKRYYCEYCDKAFADTATNRKNHLKGLAHKKMREVHYATFKDAATILEEESIKKPCRRYLQHGDCDFGDNCRFSHLTAERKKLLQEQALFETKKKKKTTSDPEPTVESWLSKRNKPTSDKDKEMITLPSYQLSPLLVGIPNLPPSLLPPTQEAFLESEPLDWG